MKRAFFCLVLSLMCCIGGLRAQSIDTIRLKDIEASFPMLGQISDLPYIGDGKINWRYKSCNLTLEFYPYRVTDSLVRRYHVNTLSGWPKMGYISEGNRLRLQYLDFKKMKKSYLRVKGVAFLSYKTTREEFVQAFHITDTLEWGPECMAPYEIDKHILLRTRCHRNRQYCPIGFYTGEDKRTFITFFFDHKRHLRFLELDYCNPETVEVYSR